MINIKKAGFRWEDLGDITAGRLNLGENMPVIIYRLFQYTLRDILEKHYGELEASQLYEEAGYLAGIEFTKNVLDISGDFDFFISNLKIKLREFKIGILNIEKIDLESLSITLTVAEDIDCSGLPVYGKTVCDYDEGFIRGIFETYSGLKFTVKEVDCWATGDRVCRFKATKK